MAAKPQRRLARPERESEMLDAAGKVFAASGFHGASMDSIAAAAGISKPMLYLYFESKEGLYTVYLARSAAALLAAVRDAAPPQAPPDERLRRGALAFLTYVEEHRAGWSVLYTEAASEAGAVAAVSAARERVADLIAWSLPLQPDADADARAACAHALTGAGESLANWWLDNPAQPKEWMAELFVGLAEAAVQSSR